MQYPNYNNAYNNNYYNYNSNNNNYFSTTNSFSYGPSGNIKPRSNQFRNIKLNKKFNKQLLNLFHQTKLSTLLLGSLVAVGIIFLVFYARSLYMLEDVQQLPEQPLNDNNQKHPESQNIRILQNDQPETPKQPQKEQKESAAARKERLLEEKRQAQFILRRRDAVKSAFIHAIEGYSTHAFGYDEVRPVSNETNSSWGGFGITLFDSLDTMLIMNLRDQYEKAVQHVLSVDFSKDHDASFFEFSIRYLGGLLGAFELSRDNRLLDKAQEMADLLIWAFDSTSGIPYSVVNLKTHVARNPSWTRGASILAEAGSVQLEFKYLSHHTKNPIYAQKAQRVMDVLFDQDHPEGLYPTYINPDTGAFDNDLVSYGGLGDSFYEYILKQYVLSGKQDTIFLKMYHEAMEGLVNRLIVRTQPPLFQERDVPDSDNGETSGPLTFIGEYRLKSSQQIPEMDHLVCYVPGMLALGSDLEGEVLKGHLKLAEELARSCYTLYAEQPTGIGPERIRFAAPNKETNKNSMKRYTVLSAKYLLRPETVESLFVLWRKTHDNKYREWGWRIFKSIEKYCRTPTAYSGLLDVTSENPDQNNSMQSFFLAETLKYLYLLFSDDDLLPLDKYVFTTEAHPLGVIIGNT